MVFLFVFTPRFVSPQILVCSPWYLPSTFRQQTRQHLLMLSRAPPMAEGFGPIHCRILADQLPDPVNSSRSRRNPLIVYVLQLAATVEASAYSRAVWEGTVKDADAALGGFREPTSQLEGHQSKPAAKPVRAFSSRLPTLKAGSRTLVMRRNRSHEQWLSGHKHKYDGVIVFTLMTTKSESSSSKRIQKIEDENDDEYELTVPQSRCCRRLVGYLFSTKVGMARCAVPPA